jgi:hypothetical protein
LGKLERGLELTAAEAQQPGYQAPIKQLCQRAANFEQLGD